jgi:FkbM family methyltransferase
MKILQIGANDGNDHVFEYIKENIQNIDQVILIDANDECIKACIQQYNGIPNVMFLTRAITCDSDKKYVDLLMPNTGNLTHAHASLSKDYLNNHTGLISKSVKAITINNLLTELNITHLDRLYVDVESLDVDIIDSIDLNNIQISFIMFEYAHSDGRDSYGGPKLDNLLQKLTNLNYSYSKEGQNVIAIQK